MADSLSPPGIDVPSPILSARLHELAGFLGAPTAGRLTEEQRALSLGIARRLVGDIAEELGSETDAAALWRDWLASGIPGADRLAGACFARAEEHRWREQSAQRLGATAPLADDEAVVVTPEVAAGASDAADRAYLALQIADRRRFDAYGHPALPLADIDRELLRALLLDIAAWRLVREDKDGTLASNLGEAVRAAVSRQDAATGIDRAATDYHAALAAPSAVAEAAAAAIVRQDWPALIALAAAAAQRSYADTALALLSAEAAALPILLAPLRLDRAAIAPLEASLAMLPARAVGGGA
ncbi:hypothetical protein ATE67_06055 [Sphingopyxis sp. H050]|uniref:hypothetical protein n=1 Tax=Sphingopyxis sp. H050 TaxID=1759072 RepID=UPI000735F073|nr:hypothetical protein [Sphingopyxis sp. H050]KTE22264.1 hypothetical protein ATE67_06055 [Sphingopyxis sp. H050]